MSVRDLSPGGQHRREADRQPVLDSFSRLHREMDRLIEEALPAMRPPFGPWFDGGGAVVPSLDVSETEDGLEISVDLPGIDAKDVSLTLSEDVLSISGERKEEQEQKKKNYYRSERSFGSFARHLALPYAVDADRVEARFKDGVLNITLPKSPQARAEERRIEIKST